MKNNMEDKLSKRILEIIEDAKEPLETTEIIEKVKQKDATRTKILYRLRDLRGEGEIKGKRLTAARGVWIWWKGKRDSLR